MECIMKDPKIEIVKITKLTPWKNNARTHSKKQIKQLQKSISEFGFTNPVLIDEDYQILAGHGETSLCTR